MSAPYFQKDRWPDFEYQGQRYGFDHLDEYVFQVEDSRKAARRIAVSFDDHCFTREWQAGDDAAWIYPRSSRRPGCFCPDRYQHSLHLPAHIGVPGVIAGKFTVISRDSLISPLHAAHHLSARNMIC
jgi:hypothetical protein